MLSQNLILLHCTSIFIYPIYLILLNHYIYSHFYPIYLYICIPRNTPWLAQPDSKISFCEGQGARPLSLPLVFHSLQAEDSWHVMSWQFEYLTYGINLYLNHWVDPNKISNALNFHVKTGEIGWRWVTGAVEYHNTTFDKSWQPRSRTANIATHTHITTKCSWPSFASLRSPQLEVGW